MFTDEVSIYRQPTQSWMWAERGRQQPRIDHSHRSNTVIRILGVLDAWDGRVQAWESYKIGVDRLGPWWLEAAKAYPKAEKIYLVMDNWPVHFHERVTRDLAKDPRIQVLRLPTYSPWLNNIEKLWLWLRQKVSHTHSWSDAFAELRQELMAELQRASGLSDIKRYCGLESLFT